MTGTRRGVAVGFVVLFLAWGLAVGGAGAVTDESKTGTAVHSPSEAVGSSAHVASAPRVSDATEADGDITVEFDGAVRAVDGGDLDASNVVVYVRPAASEAFVRWDDDGSVAELASVDQVADDEISIPGGNGWGELYPADEVKVNVVGIDDGGSYSETGNVSVDLSSAVLDEGDSRFATEDAARRLYRGTPVTLRALNDNTPLLFENADTNETLATYSTGVNSENFVFHTTEFSVGETYRVVFNPTSDPNPQVPNKGPRRVKYVALASLDLVASLEQDGMAFERDEAVTVDVSGIAKRANRPAVVEITGPNGYDDVRSATFNNAGELSDSEYSYSPGALAGGDYTVSVIDSHTGNSVTAGTFSVSGSPAPSEPNSAVFTDNVFTDTRGDVAPIGIEFENAIRGAKATVSIGSKALDTNYVTNVTVEDGDGDGRVTLLFNTYNAGTNISERVFYTPEGSADEVVSWRGEGGRFVQDLRNNYGFGTRNHTYARRATLDAGDYSLQVVAHDGTTGTVESLATVRPDDRAALSLTSRTIESSTLWVARAGDEGDVDMDYIQNQAGSSLTQSDVAAEGEVLVHQIVASGLGGAIRNRTMADPGVSVEEAFIAEEGTTNATVGRPLRLWNATFQEVDAGPNRDRYDIDVTRSNSDVFADFDASTYYIVLDLGSVRDRDEILNDNTLWNASFQINSYDAIGRVLGGRGGGTVESEWTYQDAEAPIQTTADGEIVVRNQAGQVIRSASGQTTLAPGTELTLSVESDATQSPIDAQTTTTVGPDREFAFETDMFANTAAAINFTAELRRGGELVSADATYEGEVRGLPQAAVFVDDQAVTESDQEVTIRSVSMTEGGFVAIHEGSAGGDVVGVSRHLDPGQSSNVRIVLDENVASGTTLVAMPHLDTDADQVYEFDPSDPPTPDGPYTADSAPVTDSATVTIAGAGGSPPAGVNRSQFDAATGGDDDLSRADVLRLVGEYVRTGSVSGVAIDRADVLALVSYYVRQ